MKSRDKPRVAVALTVVSAKQTWVLAREFPRIRVVALVDGRVVGTLLFVRHRQTTTRGARCAPLTGRAGTGTVTER